MALQGLDDAELIAKSLFRGSQKIGAFGLGAERDFPGVGCSGNVTVEEKAYGGPEDLLFPLLPSCRGPGADCLGDKIVAGKSVLEGEIGGRTEQVCHNRSTVLQVVGIEPAREADKAAVAHHARNAVMRVRVVSKLLQEHLRVLEHLTSPMPCFAP